VTKDKKKKLLDYFGSQVKLSRELGVGTQIVHQWFKGLRPMPLRYILKVQVLTNGKITIHELMGEKDQCYLKNIKITHE
jgi:DNA-binding transcriptional regulator YdaS (Cro superfamily)